MQLGMFTMFCFMMRSYALNSPMNHDENMLEKPGNMLRLVSVFFENFIRGYGEMTQKVIE